MAAIRIWLEFSESIPVLETMPSVCVCDAEGSRGDSYAASVWYPLNLSLHDTVCTLYVFYGKGESFHFGGCLRVSVAVRDTMTTTTLKKRKTLILTGAGLQFRDWVRYHHNRKHGSIEIDMVLERWLRVYVWIHRQQKENWDLKAYPLVTQFLHPAMPTPLMPRLLIVLLCCPMEVSFLQATKGL